jgi:GTP diphosphokinase / guanosine-3',5'-bis(diphosphate) 3'-diphosphatase
MKHDAVALERAIKLACSVHRGQVYPSPEGEPFILHPLRVMLAVSGTRRQMAAVLRDVLEDTHVTIDELPRGGPAR